MAKRHTGSMSMQQRGNRWFLLPIFLGMIGGIIAYFALRNDDPCKARNCIYLSLVLLVAWMPLVALEWALTDPAMFEP